MQEAKERKILLLLKGALAIYEESGLEIMELLNRQQESQLADALDAIGSALHWMHQEMERP